MFKSMMIAAGLSLAGAAAAVAQTAQLQTTPPPQAVPLQAEPLRTVPLQQAQVYDQSDSFGLSSAGVYSGPYLKLGGGYSYSASSRYGNSPVFDGGIGFRFTPWFRTDATFDYRSDGRDNIAGGSRFTNWAAMANAYVDFNLPIIRPVIPYIGAGVGIDQNKVGGSIVTAPGGTVADLTGSSKNQFAWQAMVGVSWYLTQTLALDVGYRYFYGGQAESGAVAGLPVRGDYSAHEVLGALRWGF